MYKKKNKKIHITGTVYSKININLASVEKLGYFIVNNLQYIFTRLTLAK